MIHRHALTEIREARGLTKKQLCDLARDPKTGKPLAPSYLTEIEAGDKPGTPQIAKRLADALAVNPLALLNPVAAEVAIAEILGEPKAS